MVTFEHAKAKQIEQLKALAEKHRGKGGSTRYLPKYQLTSLEIFFDGFKYPGRQANVRGDYYRWCVEQISQGKRINFSHLTAKILDENPGLMYVR